MLVKYVLIPLNVPETMLMMLADILIEVNEHVMKPLEEYMLFTKNGAEKVNVSNSHGVRSAQCSADFDVFHEKTPGTPNQNISQVFITQILFNTTKHHIKHRGKTRLGYKTLLKGSSTLRSTPLILLKKTTWNILS